MSENQLEKDKQNQKIATGEWFNPFGDNPEVKTEEIQTHKFEIEGIGIFEIDLSLAKNLKGLFQEKKVCLLILPNGEEVVSEDTIEEKQKQIETDLVLFEGIQAIPGSEIYAEKNPEMGKGETPLYIVELQLPSGQTIRSPLEKVILSGNTSSNTRSSRILDGTYEWKSQKIEGTLLIPNTEYMLKQIQFRIVKN
jgi:hypothetical protein